MLGFVVSALIKFCDIKVSNYMNNINLFFLKKSRKVLGKIIEEDDSEYLKEIIEYIESNTHYFDKLA